MARRDFKMILRQWLVLTLMAMPGAWATTATTGAVAAAIQTPAGVPKYEVEVLKDVVERVRTSAEAKESPLVVFDLDDTLLNARGRTYLILQKFVSDPVIRGAFPKEAAKVFKMPPAMVAYDLSDTWKKIGIENEAFHKQAAAYWSKNFFSNEYCHLDKPIPGAVSYVQQLRKAGAHIVYITGRDELRMGECTRRGLKKQGFVMGSAVTLILKPSKEIGDLQFKEEAFASIKAKGKVVAGFENEPANINAMQVVYPDAQLVFLDTAHSNRPEIPAPGIRWVPDYRMQKR